MKTETFEKLANLQIPTISADVPNDLIPEINQGINQLKSEHQSRVKQKIENKNLAARRNLEYEIIVKNKIPEIFRKYVSNNLEWRFNADPDLVQPDEGVVITIPGLPEFQMKYSGGNNEWLYRLSQVYKNFDGKPDYEYPSIFTSDKPAMVLGKLVFTKTEYDSAMRQYELESEREQEKTSTENRIDAENEPVYVDDDPTINEDFPAQRKKDYDVLAYELINMITDLVDSRLSFHGLL